jgi:integrase
VDLVSGKVGFEEAMQRTRSASTARRYMQGVDGLLDWIHDESPTLDGGEPGILDSFVRYLIEKKNLSAKTIEVHVAAVFRYFDWLRRRGANVPPFLRPEMPRKEDEGIPKKVLTLSELRIFLGGAGQLSEPARTALWLMPRTGLRSIEMVGLRVKDIQVFRDASRESWVILRVLGKGRRKRFVPVFRSGGVLLSAYLRGWRSKVSSDYLFPGVLSRANLKVRDNQHLTTRALRENTQVLREQLGIEGLSPHALRRTYNTMLDDAGVSPYIAAQLMGHRVSAPGTSNIAQSHYVHHAVEKLVDAVRNIDVPEVGEELMPEGIRHRSL